MHSFFEQPLKNKLISKDLKYANNDVLKNLK